MKFKKIAVAGLVVTAGVVVGHLILSAIEKRRNHDDVNYLDEDDFPLDECEFNEDDDCCCSNCHGCGTACYENPDEPREQYIEPSVSICEKCNNDDCGGCEYRSDDRGETDEYA